VSSQVLSVALYRRPATFRRRRAGYLSLVRFEPADKREADYSAPSAGPAL
jgi:hypothetical protein